MQIPHESAKRSLPFPECAAGDKPSHRTLSPAGGVFRSRPASPSPLFPPVGLEAFSSPAAPLAFPFSSSTGFPPASGTPAPHVLPFPGAPQGVYEILVAHGASSLEATRILSPTPPVLTPERFKSHVLFPDGFREMLYKYKHLGQRQARYQYATRKEHDAQDPTLEALSHASFACRTRARERKDGKGGALIGRAGDEEKWGWGGLHTCDSPHFCPICSQKIYHRDQ